MTIAKIPIYKVEWLVRGRGVYQEYFQAKTSEIAKNKAKRRYGIAKSQQVATKVISIGRRIPVGLGYFK